jgi:hypothetical protein
LPAEETAPAKTEPEQTLVTAPVPEVEPEETEAQEAARVFEKLKSMKTEDADADTPGE